MEAPLCRPCGPGWPIILGLEHNSSNYLQDVFGLLVRTKARLIAEATDDRLEKVDQLFSPDQGSLSSSAPWYQCT